MTDKGHSALIHIVLRALSGWLGRRLAVAVRDRGHVDLVAVVVGERPPRRGVVVAYQSAARRQSGIDARLGLLVGQPDREVDRAQVARSCLLHLLEPERWEA